MTTRNYLAHPADSKDIERITRQLLDGLEELRAAIESIEIATERHQVCTHDWYFVSGDTGEMRCAYCGETQN